MSLQAGVNQQVSAPFTVFGIDGVTPIPGLLAGSFTHTLSRDGVASALPVAVAEVSGGDYVAVFTPDAVGVWYLRVLDPYGSHWGVSVEVSPDNPGTAVTLVRKYVTNAQAVDITTQEFVVYDDDGVTALQRHDLSTTGGEDVTTNTGVQTTRGPGKL